MMKRFIEALVCALMLVGCGGAGADKEGSGGEGAGAGSPATNAPGKYDEALTAAGQARTLIVYVPELAEGTPVPVVFMLHGTSGDGQRFYEVSGWKEKADEEGMIVVFPDALKHCFFEDENHDGDFDDAGERKVTTKWSSGQIGDGFPLCTDEDVATLSAEQQALVEHPVADDIAFFDAMLTMLSEKYLVDEAAVYVTGFSNGGQMSARLAVERSEKIAAAHFAAGTLTVQTHATRPISTVFSVGSLDDRFTAAAGVAELPLTEAGLGALPLFQGIVGTYLEGLGLGQAYSFDSLSVGNKSIARFSFSTSLVGADNTFEAFVIEGLYHQYPNGDNHVVSAADTLWPFFEAHRLP